MLKEPNMEINTGGLDGLISGWSSKLGWDRKDLESGRESFLGCWTLHTYVPLLLAMNTRLIRL